MKQTPLRHQFSPLEIRKCTLRRRGVLLIPFALACFALSSQARATCQQGCGFPDPSNTFLGQDTLISNTIGSDNTAVGSDALYNNTSGFQNTAMGDQALYNNTTGPIIPPRDSRLSNSTRQVTSTPHWALLRWLLPSRPAACHTVRRGTLARGHRI